MGSSSSSFFPPPRGWERGSFRAELWAFEGGFAIAALGLAVHFGIVFAATAIFYWLSRRISAMVEWVVPSGILFGVVWLLVMYRGIIPLLAALRPLYLSNVVKRPLPALSPLPMLVHMTCVDLQIALAVRRFGPWPEAERGSEASRLARITFEPERLS